MSDDSGNRGKPQPSARSCVIATYNVQNLFAADASQPKPGAARRALIRTINRLGADVLVLQEVGSKPTLQALNDDLRDPFPWSDLLPGNSMRSIHIGYLSRYPMTLTSHRHWPLVLAEADGSRWYASAEDALADRASALRLQRDVVLAEIEITADLKLAVFGVHLKSHGNPSWQAVSAGAIRRAECQAVVDIVSAFRRRHPEVGVVIAGDFNDRPDGEALEPLQQLDLVDPLEGILTRTGKRPSSYWPKRRARFDRLLVTPALLPRVAESTTCIHASNLARTASDHYPVTLGLEWPRNRSE